MSKQNNKTPLFSIVIPFYNAQEYIGECIDTLLSQTFRDFELICVNDGSTDNSEKVIRDRMSENSNVILLNQKGNAGTARNLGLRNAAGEYLLFLDADDFFSERLLERLSQKISQTSPDLILFAGKTFDDKIGKASDGLKFLNTEYVPGSPCFSAYDIRKNLYQVTNPSPWTKCFRRSFIAEIGVQFQSLPNANDLYFDFAALSSAERISSINEALVYYRINTGSSTQDGKSKNPLCFLNALEALYSYLQERGLLTSYYISYVHETLSHIKYNLETNHSQEAKLDILRTIQRSPLFCGLVYDAEDVYQQSAPTLAHALFIRAALDQMVAEEKRHIDIRMDVVCQPSYNEEPLVSVIIPVYNCEEYIADTITSVLSQTFDSFEIVCVDDGSTDGSLKILRDMASLDGRIGVYRQPNSGPSTARNNGLRVAKGKYTIFLDGDDLYEPNALSLLAGCMEAEELDMILFDAISFFETEELEKAHPSYQDYYNRSGRHSGVYTGIDLMSRLHHDSEYLPSPCLYMVKRALSSTIQFIPGIIHEDNAFTYELMLKAKNTKHLNKKLYRRRVRSCSIMTSEKKFANVYGYFVCYKQMRLAYEGAKVSAPEMQQALVEIYSKTIAGARNCYVKLDAAQKGGIQALSPGEMSEFYYLIEQPSLQILETRRLKRAVKKRDKTIKELKKKLDRRMPERLKGIFKRWFNR